MFAFHIAKVNLLEEAKQLLTQHVKMNLLGDENAVKNLLRNNLSKIVETNPTANGENEKPWRKSTNRNLLWE